MKPYLPIILLCILLTVTYSFTSTGRQSEAVEEAVEFFKTEAKAFTASALKLEQAVSLVSSTRPETVSHAKEMLGNCRMHYKKIEFFLAYFFPQAALVYNAPAKYEVEEPSLEFRDPVGLQVIESLLFDRDPESKKIELLQQCEVVVSSAADLASLLYLFNASDSQLLESIRLELVRVIALNITGYDAPLLKTGIRESAASLRSVRFCLLPLAEPGNPLSDSVFQHLGNSIQFLEEAKDFDSFDRLTFLTAHALPLQRNLHRFINQNKLNINSTPALNYDAGDLFAAGAINISSFPNTGRVDNGAMVALGRELFSEKALSGNSERSCASCHVPEKFFADGLVKSKAFDGKATVGRNTPSLLYSAFQYSQFWDGKVNSLEEQVMEVMKSPLEMNAEDTVVIKRLKAGTKYKPLFESAFPKTSNDAVTIENLAAAVAAFVRTLNPLSADFDRYIQGDRSALTQEQKHGFNLFMGKAQCGTCHFAPLFNGLIPPLYNRTEFEVLGTPASEDFTKAAIDKDSGRFHFFPSRFYTGAFKTPTARNSAVTGPYMHHGAFSSLEKVMDFYNQGGGLGLGLDVETQTLSSAPLELSSAEVKAVIAFLGSLTDLPVQAATVNTIKKLVISKTNNGQ